MNRSSFPLLRLALLVAGVWSLSGGCGGPTAPQEAVSQKPAPPTVAQDVAPATQIAEQFPDAAAAEAVASAETTPPSSPDKPDRGRQLYAQHCAACHGENGNGQGLAARFIYPKPRDFRSGRFRLISNPNGVPSLDDLQAVLVRGMPGSSMVSWNHLPAADRQLLAETVLSFRREGAADIERQLAAEADEELTAEDLADRVAALTTPEPAFEPGKLPATTPETVARGQQLYVAKGCAACHGTTGKGDGQQAMVDAEGLATRPRDLTLGIFKGNHDALSVYRRLWLGLPGSPMPASPNLTSEETAAMVDYVLSLSNEEIRTSHVLRRREITAVLLEVLPDDQSESEWATIPATEVQLTPLWWREGATPTVTVQVAHSASELALRLSWNDATANERAVLPDEFEDMVAAQFYAGPAEPFLGMGAFGATIDLWQWRACYKADGAEDMLSDEYPLDTPTYAKLLGDQPLPDFVTARVAGNPLALRQGTAGSLSAGGFGSTTFRPEPSQLVTAQAKWQAGRWRVVLRRPLTVPAGGGLSFEPGQRCSVALAVWDGEARDRAAQKLISLWNDLIVE